MRFRAPILGVTLALTLTAGTLAATHQHEDEVTSEVLAADTFIASDAADEMSFIRSAQRAAEARARAAAEQARARAAAVAAAQERDRARRAAEKRASRSRRVGTDELKTPQGFEAWRTSGAAHRVANCESGGNPKSVSRTGKYRGKWQMDSDFWSSYGGLRFASRPELASEYEQDLVAYRGWLARGWRPWSCRSAI